MRISGKQKKLWIGGGILIAATVVIYSMYLLNKESVFYPSYNNQNALRQGIEKKIHLGAPLTPVQQSMYKQMNAKPIHIEQEVKIPLIQTKAIQDKLKELAMDKHDIALSIKAMSRLILVGDYPEIRKALSNDLTVTTWQISLNAAKGLAMAGDYSGFDTVKRALEKGGWSAKIDAAKAMGLYGNEGRAVLENLTNNPDRWIKLGAQAGLAELGDKQAAEVLAKGLGSSDTATQDYCARSLAEIGDERAKTYFDKLFASNNPYIKAEGAEYLYLLGDEQAKAYLAAMLEDVDPYWQNYAVITLTEKRQQ